MTLSRGLIASIATAVEREDGDMRDVEDLVATWERLRVDGRGRVDRMRYEAANPRCRCVDGGDPGEEGRCSRCWGRVR